MFSTRSLSLRAAALLLLLLATPLTASAGVVEDAELEPEWLRDALDDYWDEQFSDADLEYEAPEVVFYEDELETGCGDLERGTVPYYCPADDAIYLADFRYDAIVEDRGETFWVIEVATIWGGAVIWQLGLADSDDDEPVEAADAPFLNWCLGGAFLDYAVDEDLLDADDVEETFEELEDGFSEDALDELTAGFDDGLADGCELDLADTGGGDDDDDGRSDGGGGAGDVYESPQYGYTITYDAEVWELYLEDDSPDDPYDRVCFRNGVSVICVTGDPDYDEDEMDTCLDDYLGGLENSDGASDIEELDESDAFGEEDGRAWGTYTYVFESEDGDEFDVTRYYDCTWIEDGLTIVILHNVPSDDYEDEVEAREEFVQGIDSGSGSRDDEDDEDAEEDTDTEDGEDAEDGDVAGGDEAVEIVDFEFSPDELVVEVGTTVTWTNGDGVRHTVTADDESFDSGRLDEGESFEVTFDEPGDYDYHCDVHPDMTGTIAVE